MVFIVAEIGINWDGDFELVKDLMKNAKKAGFDAVKFQAFDKNITKNHPESNRLLKSSISKSNVNKIDKISREIDIEWFCTPMYPDAVNFLEPFVQRYKIRELDGRLLLENNSTSLIEKVLDTGKEVFVSSNRSPKHSKLYTNKKIKWLYCVPKYPCSINDLDFSSIDDFQGYSNHCNDISAVIEAASCGIEIIEIHVTADKSKNYIDNPVSFNFEECGFAIKKIKK